jgi:hypothetical protein
MNLISPDLLERKSSFPHMRFLFNDPYILEMSLELLFEGIRGMTLAFSEKEKMR